MSTTWYLHYEPGVDTTFARASTATEFRDVQEPDTPTLERPFFGTPIHSDAGTLSGGDWESTMPLSRMQNRDQTDRARSTNDSTTATQFTLDLGSDPDDWRVRAIAIFGHNLSRGARWRVTGSDESDAVPSVFESDWLESAPEVFPWGVLRAGEPGFSDGRPAESQPNQPLIVFVPEGVACRYWLFEFEDLSNPDGYVEFGRLIVCDGFQAEMNFVAGAELGVITGSTREENDGGGFFFDERYQRRTVAGSFDHLSVDWALVRLYEMDRLLGTTRQFLFVKDPTGTYHLRREAFPAVMESLTPFQHPEAYLKREKAVAIVEDF